MSHPTLKDIFVLSAKVVSKASAKTITIGTAESCTGGLIGAAITSISGSSACFHGGIIAYDNRIKQENLGVQKATLEGYGAVSSQTAKAMAEGAIRTLSVDMAVSVTGIAGPGGGTEEKPVGTVWIGFAFKEKKDAGSILSTAELFKFGDIGRNKIRDITCYEALKTLTTALN